MAELQDITPADLEAFLASPKAVLMLGKTDCAACAQWTTELNEYLGHDEEFSDVRFGKLILNQGRLGRWKKANPWLAEVDVLPYNVIYIDGEPVKRWAGGGLERLQNRLRRYQD